MQVAMLHPNLCMSHVLHTGKFKLNLLVGE
jgi:hypothetical protein